MENCSISKAASLVAQFCVDFYDPPNESRRRKFEAAPALVDRLAELMLIYFHNSQNHISRECDMSQGNGSREKVAVLCYDESMRLASGELSREPSLTSLRENLFEGGKLFACTPRAWNPCDKDMMEKQPSDCDILSTPKADGVRARLHVEEGVAFLRNPRVSDAQLRQVTDAGLMDAFAAAGVRKAELDVEVLYVHNGVTLPPHQNVTEFIRHMTASELEQPVHVLLHAIDVFSLELDKKLRLEVAPRSASSSRNLRVAEPEHYLYDFAMRDRAGILETLCNSVNEHLKPRASKRVKSFAGGSHTHFVFKPSFPFASRGSDLSPMELACQRSYYLLPPGQKNAAAVALGHGYFGEPALQFMDRWERAVKTLTVLSERERSLPAHAADRRLVEDVPRFVYQETISAPRGGFETVLVGHDGVMLRNLNAAGRNGVDRLSPAHARAIHRNDPAAYQWGEAKVKFTPLHSSDLDVTRIEGRTVTLASCAQAKGNQVARQVEQTYTFDHTSDQETLFAALRVGSVVECPWDPVRKQWRPLSLRLDKDRPNFFEVVRDTKEVAIHQLSVGFRAFGRIPAPHRLARTNGPPKPSLPQTESFRREHQENVRSIVTHSMRLLDHSDLPKEPVPHRSAFTERRLAIEPCRYLGQSALDRESSQYTNQTGLMELDADTLMAQVSALNALFQNSE